MTLQREETEALKIEIENARAAVEQWVQQISTLENIVKRMMSEHESIKLDNAMLRNHAREIITVADRYETLPLLLGLSIMELRKTLLEMETPTAEESS